MTFDPNALLTEKLAALEHRLALVELPPIESTGDTADLRMRALEFDRTLDGRARMARMKQRIQAALAKLQRGEYGRCEDCQAEIPSPRLRVTPEAECCVRCGEKRERTRSGFAAVYDEESC